MGDGWYGGRLRPVPDPPPDDEEEPRPAAANYRVDEATGLWDASELWERDTASAPGDGEPLFEQLRSTYLYGDDSSEWARAGEDTGGWATDDSGQWAAGAVGVEGDEDRYRWVDSPSAWDSESEAWDDDVDEYDDYEDLDDEEELDPEPLAPRARGRRRSGAGRAGLRRTSTLLNTSSILLLVVGTLVAAGLTAWILGEKLLTTRQLFFLTHSTLGIIIVHAFGGGVGTWFGYAGYRAKVPPGGNIAMYPREYLLHSPQLAFWETFAMEWKVHIGWTTPFLATAVAFTALRYRRRLVADRLVRKVMTIMLLLAFAGALVAAGLGAVINVTAPNDFMHRGWSP